MRAATQEKAPGIDILSTEKLSIKCDKEQVGGPDNYAYVLSLRIGIEDFTGEFAKPTFTQVHLTPAFFAKLPPERRPFTYFHELTHAWAGLVDHGYWNMGSWTTLKGVPVKMTLEMKLRNANSYERFLTDCVKRIKDEAPTPKLPPFKFENLGEIKLPPFKFSE